MEWSGVMPAITTKFSNDDKLDLGLFNKNLDFQLQAGIDAIVLGGSLGEASTLTQDEKNILTQNTVDFVSNKIPIVVNIAEQSTKDALKSVKCAEKFGEEAVELIVASIKKGKKAIIGEAADTLYHMCVLLRSKNISIQEVLSELVSREGVSGIEEKRKRNLK